MPGSKGDYDKVLAIVKENRKQVEVNATRIYRMVKKLTEEML